MKTNMHLVVAAICAVGTLVINPNLSAREISASDARFTQLGEYIAKPSFNQPALGTLSKEARGHLVEKSAKELGIAGTWWANEHRSSARLVKLSDSARLLCDPQGDKKGAVAPLYVLPCGNRMALVEFVPPVAKPEPPKPVAKPAPTPKPEPPKAKPTPAPKPQPPKKVKCEPPPAPKPIVVNNTYNTTIVVVSAAEPAPTTATVETTPPAPKPEEKKVVEVTGASGAKIEVSGGTTVRIIDFTGGQWQQPPCEHPGGPPPSAKKGCD
jgi:hypothetical protein